MSIFLRQNKTFYMHALLYEEVLSDNKKCLENFYVSLCVNIGTHRRECVVMQYTYTCMFMCVSVCIVWTKACIFYLQLFECVSMHVHAFNSYYSLHFYC